MGKDQLELISCDYCGQSSIKGAQEFFYWTIIKKVSCSICHDLARKEEVAAVKDRNKKQYPIIQTIDKIDLDQMTKDIRMLTTKVMNNNLEPVSALRQIACHIMKFLRHDSLCKPIKRRLTE